MGSISTNTLIVAHGSGNLIVGNAVAKGKCSIDKTSLWIELQVRGATLCKALLEHLEHVQRNSRSACGAVAVPCTSQDGLPLGRLTAFADTFCAQLHNDAPNTIGWAQQLQDDLHVCEPGTPTPTVGWKSLVREVVVWRARVRGSSAADRAGMRGTRERTGLRLRRADRYRRHHCS